MPRSYQSGRNASHVIWRISTEDACHICYRSNPFQKPAPNAKGGQYDQWLAANPGAVVERILSVGVSGPCARTIVRLLKKQARNQGKKVIVDARCPGGKPAQKVTIDGVDYASIKAAARALKCTRYRVGRLCGIEAR